MPALTDLIEEFVQLARAAATTRGCRLQIERSHPTEAVYLRLWRDGYWFGLRIAAHRPAYACSADFQQLLLPVSETPPEFCRHAAGTVERFVRDGGCVVADPVEVQQAVQLLFVNSSTLGRRRWPSTAEVCAVRHRLNMRAAWGYEIETGHSAQCPPASCDARG
ncbi:MAG: hypothetical protein NXI04_04225 [Planctomycetaceae bacterium]|nr:hypothetical protein [Planctomycetaceae bacterium]